MNKHPSLLNVENLSVDFQLRGRTVTAIESIDLNVQPGETVAIVGESGSGKSVTSLAIMGLIRKPGIIRTGKVSFNGEDLLALSARKRRKHLGKELSMIFQEPSVSLNPSFTIENQITEVLKLHDNLNRSACHDRALALLDEVGINDPDRYLKLWPHQLSGGMNQRVMIAMAIACNPSLLIADEPTTALDVTVQAQILDLLHKLQLKNNMGMVFISHDLAIIPNIAHRVVVMYAGQVVESCLVTDLFQQPQHPYTEALLRSLPASHRDKNERLFSIKGSPPKAGEVLSGCRFYKRCNYAKSNCYKESPELLNTDASSSSSVRCFHPLSNVTTSSVETA
jgi:dipeptide transport system ATP-binding protein